MVVSIDLKQLAIILVSTIEIFNDGLKEDLDSVG